MVRLRVVEVGHRLLLEGRERIAVVLAGLRRHLHRVVHGRHARELRVAHRRWLLLEKVT